MPKMYFAFFLSFTYFIFLPGQGKSQGSLAGHSIIIKVSPQSALDLTLPTLQVGAEYQINRFGLELDYGAPLYHSLLGGRHGTSYWSFHKIRTELKYFIPIPSNPIKELKGYLGFEYFKVQENFSDQNNGFVDGNGYPFHFDSDRVSYSVHGICLKAGYYVYAGRFIADLFSGIGIRNVQVHHDPVGATPDPSFHRVNEWGFIGPPYTTEADFNRIHISLGFKVGYLLIGKTR
ncbi:hypothetical protein WSM22_36080 [Cytophagales bacterium WSM2-2]|nr:hypothetical protein WSM22_36080 [Cytophagales bacterium WSM2-2]